MDARLVDYKAMNEYNSGVAVLAIPDTMIATYWEVPMSSSVPSPEISKACPKCGERKPLPDFGIRRQSADGREARCRACEQARLQAYRDANRELIRFKGRMYMRQKRGSDLPAEIVQTVNYWRMDTETGERIKRCSYCGVDKSESHYGLTTPTRRKSRCKECLASIEAAAYASDPIKLRKRSRNWANRHPDQVRAMRVRDAVQNRIAGKQWRERNRTRARETWARRRARLRGALIVERVDRAAIIERDKSTCYLWCGRVLEEHEVTLDHVIPLARGGQHTADNLRVACIHCNRRKCAKLLEELV